jgi:hypothetical protein
LQRVLQRDAAVIHAALLVLASRATAYQMITEIRLPPRWGSGKLPMVVVPGKPACGALTAAQAGVTIAVKGAGFQVHVQTLPPRPGLLLRRRYTIIPTSYSGSPRTRIASRKA